MRVFVRWLAHAHRYLSIYIDAQSKYTQTLLHGRIRSEEPTRGAHQVSFAVHGGASDANDRKDSGNDSVGDGGGRRGASRRSKKRGEPSRAGSRRRRRERRKREE